MATLEFTKGHGTGNDFVLFADPDGEIDLSAAQIAAIWAALRSTSPSGSANSTKSLPVP